MRQQTITDIALLVAANQFRGDFEERVELILDAQIPDAEDEAKAHVYARIVEGVQDGSRIQDIERLVGHAVREVGL